MKRAQLIDFGKPLVLNTASDPDPKDSEVLLEVLACGVCHSDLHIREGYYELGSGKKMWVKDRGVSLPLTPGHEVVGRILKIGSKVVGVSVGERFLVYPWIGCNACSECQADLPHLCASPKSLGVYQDGGYSDRILVPDQKWLIPIGNLKPEVACSYACAGLTAFSALKKALPLSEKETLVIIGAGGLGFFAAQIVRCLTNANIIFLDVDSDRLKKIGEFDSSFQTMNSSVGEAEIRKCTGTSGAKSVVDFVNNSETAALAFSLLSKNGKQICVGLFGGEVILQTPIIALKNLKIQGSYTGSPIELMELLNLVSSNRLLPVPIHLASLNDANSILDSMAGGKGLGRTVLIPTS
ncbi:alcohol dehydrogenase, catalytic domain, GroES-like family [Leptospira broomii serovar Hurstbridge str. 5399]|uniref:Alcohol dehydrogenase, catalytic domain, GroES-like family n=1 Tax=Leptospira broomii serovar Hurstbridge str. 5399 TaxID=1049789 RepID=T0FHY5_9LEPT|nr:alcohol dehydrogenase [Leptospira broomii]EQA47207.1 alcohol dehydrogenase, catalytic domain, GroES-like family [Leptospira broomii serovar Hurstbridge str. 5399]